MYRILAVRQGGFYVWTFERRLVGWAEVVAVLCCAALSRAMGCAQLGKGIKGAFHGTLAYNFVCIHTYIQTDLYVL
jgi:hypothetical protein